jgi:hypothetical protein
MISPALPPNPQACWSGPQAPAQAQSESKLSSVRQSSEHRAQTRPGFLPPQGPPQSHGAVPPVRPALLEMPTWHQWRVIGCTGCLTPTELALRLYGTIRDAQCLTPVPVSACRDSWPSVAVLCHESTMSLQRISSEYSLVSVFRGLR